MIQWLICFFVLTLTSFAHAEADLSKGEANGPTQEYHLIIDGMPRDVSKIEVGSFSNAVENVENHDDLTAIVAFRVLNVVKEDLSRKKYLPRLNLKAILSAATPRQFKKFFKREPLSAGDDLEKRWFRIAVKDPLETFAIRSWDEPEPMTYRIYLNRHQDMKNTFVMIKAERMS